MKMINDKFTLNESAVDFEKVSPQWDSSQYWARRLTNQLGRRPQSHSEEETEAALLDQAKQKYVAKVGDDIVGAIAYQFDGSQGIVIATHLGSMMKGVGTELLRKAMNFASRMKVPLHLESSSAAMGFYEKLGFENEGGNIFVWYPSGSRSLVREMVKEVMMKT